MFVKNTTEDESMITFDVDDIVLTQLDIGRAIGSVRLQFLVLILLVI